MKVNKKYVVLMLVAVLMLALCVTAFAESYQTLYAEDGRSKAFPVSKVEAQLTVGWYTYPVQRLYHPSRKSEVFYKSDVTFWLECGWYEEPVQWLYTPEKTQVFLKSEVEAQLKLGWSKEPFVLLTALDGRTKYVEKSKVAANKKVGWYEGKPVKVYAEDGRTKYISSVDIAANEKVGWYTEPVQRLYHPDEKSEVFKKSDVSYKLRCGWYEEPVQRLYAEGGKSKVFPKSKVAAQLKVGWYTEPVQRLYAEGGKSKVFPKSKVAAQLKVGWYTEPVEWFYHRATGSKLFPVSQKIYLYRNGWSLYQPLYTLDGRCEYFLVSKVKAQLKVGWYTYPVTKIYAEDGRTKIIKKSDLEAYKKVGWYVSPVITVYNLEGKTKKIADIEKKEYEKNGWYTFKPTAVYASDGRTKGVRASEVEAYEKVGWSRYPFFQIECKEDNREYGQKFIYWKYVPGVKNHTVTIIEKRNSPRGEFAANNIAANKPVVIKNVTSNYVYVNTYPNCSYTIKVSGGKSKGEKTFYIGGAYDSDKRHEVYKNSPKTKAEADKLMVSVTVPVWKLSNGKKVSSTATLTVHKDIAGPIKNVFNEIYKGKEKFPIKDMGAYQWRGGTTEHNSGTAIDINSNENYCIYGNGTVVGSHWSPGKDPYSIKPYGDVVRAFEKHGFTWGGDAWSSTIDYMHFSYCGT